MSLDSLASLFSALCLCEEALNLAHIVANHSSVDAECAQSTTKFKPSN